jgi:Flp pilus assembly protein TadG
MATLTRVRRRGGDDTGAELIEFALVLPILLLVIAGIVDFGFLFQRFQVVTNASREGARLAALPGYTPADVEARVQNYLTSGGLTAVAVAPPVCAPQVLPGGQSVNVTAVTVEYPSQFSFIGPFAAMFGGSGWTTITLRATSAMRREVPSC